MHPESPSHLLKDLHRLDLRLSRWLSRPGGPAAETELSGANRRILLYLCAAAEENRPVYQKDLETVFGITRSTASRVLELMERKGWLLRLPVEEDARLKRLALTPRAEDIAGDMRRNFNETAAMLTRGFSPEELQQLHVFLDRMHQNLEAAAAAGNLSKEGSPLDP